MIRNGKGYALRDTGYTICKDTGYVIPAWFDRNPPTESEKDYVKFQGLKIAKKSIKEYGRGYLKLKNGHTLF